MSRATFQGYAIHDTKKWEDFKKIDFESKTFGDHDIEVKINYCGVCGSDLHTIKGDWGTPMYPLIPGHEIVGVATKVGPKVASIKKGDRVGVGAQVYSCLECKFCKSDNEQYCPKMVDTYNAKYPNGDVAYGGYATGVTAHERFVFPIPDAIEDKHAGPLLCAGLTVFSPLIRYGCKAGAKVGVVGIGGLGHLAVQFAAAMGADVYAFSHSDSKKEDALKMGAKHFIIYDDEGKFAEEHAQSFDVIVSTTNNIDKLPVTEFLSMLMPGCRMVQVGLPSANINALKPAAFASGGSLTGSHVGSKPEALKMLDLVAKHPECRPWITELKMSEAGLANKNLNDGKARYRYVLKNDIA